MSVATKVDFSELKKRFAKLAVLENKTGEQVLLDQARLLTRDLIKMTPPTTRDFSDSLNEHRRRGLATVRADVGNLWKGSLSVIKYIQVGNARAAMYLERYRRAGNISAFTRIIRNFGFQQEVQATVTESEHDAKRNTFMTGRPAGREKQVIVLQDNAVKALQKTKLAHVGTLKGGWSQAALALGAKMPAWTQGHPKSRGIFLKQLHGPKKSITIGNLVPFREKYGGAQAMIQRALRLRANAIDKRIQHLMKEPRR